MTRTLTAEDVRLLLRKRCEEAGSQAMFAVQNGLSRHFLNDVLKGRQSPSEHMADILGLEKFSGWRNKSLAGRQNVR